jgi:mono/diheme cytochrome c family protein
MWCCRIQLVRRAAGLALLAAAVGCGGKVAGEESDSEAPRAAPRASPPYATSPPQRTAPPPVSTPSATPTPAPPSIPPPPRPLPQTDDGSSGSPQLARAAAENVLLANCGLCHGPALTPEQASARINYINDIDQLVEVGLIVPLNTAESRLVQLMLGGSMPPAASGYPPVTEADIAIVTRYIDNPRYWADFSPPPVGDVDAGLLAPAVDAGVDGG